VVKVMKLKFQPTVPENAYFYELSRRITVHGDGAK
jgi:hypothetical protein